MNYEVTLQDARLSDLDSEVTNKWEEIQARHVADALIGPLGVLLKARRKAVQQSGTALVNNSLVEFPEITNMAEMGLIEGYLNDV